MLDHDHWLEWLWLVGAIAGNLVAAVSLKWCIQTQTVLDCAGVTGPPRLALTIHTRADTFRLGMTIIMLAAAIVNLLIPPPPPTYSQVPQNLASVVAWNGMALAILCWSWLDRQSRYAVANALPSSAGPGPPDTTCPCPDGPDGTLTQQGSPPTHGG